MTKWIVAAGMMITAALATAPSSAPRGEDELATGSCRYTCSSNGRTYLNRTQCIAACSGVCELDAC